MSTYAVLIPARDEEETLPVLFERLRGLGEAGPHRTVVVDNGSRDGTAEIARGLGAEVVSETRPGYGQACLAGLAHLRDSEPPEAVVFLDADDFAAPAQLPRLLSPIHAGEADMVIGERRSEDRDGVRWHARLGNDFVLAIMRWRYGSSVRDMGPFRAVRFPVLEDLALDDRNYGWYVQMQVRALRAGYRVIGLPVDFHRRTVGSSKVSGSAIGSIRAGSVMLRTLAVEVLRRGP